MNIRLCFIALCFLFPFSAQAAAPEKLELKQGDHIAIIGNALGERMQHDGTLEALVHKAHPQHDLVFRNLAFAADEVVTRTRSENFGSPEEWLKKVQADVVCAFFGFNESFKGNEGVEKFKSDLDKLLKETLKANYSGKGAPRVVLFSPIAQEKMPDPNLPAPAANHTNLQTYTAAMAEVAQANDVQFVNLFTASQQSYASAKQRLTFNGMHLTEHGYQQLAPAMFQALFAQTAPAAAAALETLRAAVRDRNQMWFSRYRTVDGYNVYGGRSKMEYEQGKGGPKLSNFHVMQQEMSVRDTMTANRDQRVWALAKGRDLKVDDSNLPPVTPVKSNKPGPLPDGGHPYLDPVEAIARMKTPPGVKVNLFASEKEFPELVNPVQMAWDTKGRLWIAAWKHYPGRTPWSKDGDRLLVLDDTDGDGKADKCTTFLGDLNCPTGFQFYKDGVLVMKAPDLIFARDTDGDGVADSFERVLNGIDAADSHHETNSMVLEPGGATYLSDGVFHRTQVETPSGPVRNSDGAIYRYEPRTAKFERYVAYGFANPHGRVFDRWGNDIITDATGNENFFGPAFSGRIDNGKHAKLKQFWNRPSRPCAGTGILSSRHFPEEYAENFLNCNVIGMQGIFRVKVTEKGSGLKGETLEHLVMSDDPNFRPSGVSTGPDGAVYFMDWSNAIIGHLQHHLRDPNRDAQHGRIYRMTYEGRPLLKPAKIDGEPIPALIERLKEPENDVRTRAKTELGKRDSAEVIAATKQWAASLDKATPAYEHHMLEALWVHQWHNVVDLDLLKRMLQSPDARARAQAVRVLGYWRDRVPEPLAALKTAAADEHPRVRLEAVRVASFFEGDELPAAVDVAYTILAKPTDDYLDYTLRETLKQLNSFGREMILPSDPQTLASLIERMSDAELIKAPANETVLLARLERKSIDLAQRERALGELAKLRKSDRETEIISALQRLDGKGEASAAAADDLGKLLGTSEAATLVKARADLATLAVNSKLPGVRSAAWAALISADAKPEATWGEARTDEARISLLRAIHSVPDPGLRAGFQPVLNGMLNDAQKRDQLSAPMRAAALRALPLMGTEHGKTNFTIAAEHLQRGIERPSAARAITQLPRESWNPEVVGPVTAAVLEWAKTVPTDQRTSEDFVEIVQAGNELAALLPTPEAIRVRKELRDLGVSVFIIKTVREQMRYDTPRLVVEPGKQFQIIFENIDAMPHNIVFVQPGTRQAVAESVQTMKPDQLDKKGRSYVPPENDRRVFEASRMLEAGEKETLKIKAPSREGEYEYVCTFPGHWMIMWGKLIVTKDVDAYLQSHPEPTPAPGTAAAHAHEH